MDLRVTQQTTLQRALNDTRRLTAQLAGLQSQAATGKRLSKVSDDPATALAILESSSREQALGTHLENILAARTALNGGVSVLQQVSSLFSEARSLAIEASHSVNDSASFNALANQVDALLQRLLDLANSQQDDTYLFSGAGGKSQPFVVTNTNPAGRPTEVRYQGADEASAAIVERNRQVAIYYPGIDVFMARQRQAPVFYGTTGAKPGAGTNTATGQRALRLQHANTTFAVGSGVQAGLDSPAKDTILGPLGMHQLHITDTTGLGSAGTVTLDGGPTFAFTSADTNLQVTNSSGDVVYLNMTAITPNFDGDVAITADGVMSIDGSASSTTISFTADQIARDSQTNAVIFVDTSAIERAGIETVEHPGTYDAFQSLMTLRDELRNVNQRTEHVQFTTISRLVGELDQVGDRVLEKMGEQSATLHSLESLESHLREMQTAAKKTVSELGDVDLPELVVKLQAHEQMLQVAMATFARLNSQSLLDFLR